MNWGSPEFVLIIIALSTGGWLIKIGRAHV